MNFKLKNLGMIFGIIMMYYFVWVTFKIHAEIMFNYCDYLPILLDVIMIIAIYKLLMLIRFCKEAGGITIDDLTNYIQKKYNIKEFGE